MKAKSYLLISFSLITIALHAQINFSNRNDLLGERDMHSGVPVAIADMNGDGLDDIVSMNRGNHLFIQYQTPDPNRPFIRYDLPTHIDNDTQNDICIADFNNDGANDIFTVGSYDRVKILYGIPYSYEFTFTFITVIPFFSQGASAGDFNGDGWVDVVMLNDNGLNYTMINDGAGNLVDSLFFDFATVPQSDNSGNYGSVYTDFDMDGDNDFYIAKCRQGITNQTDPRRIDVLFVNDGNNNYTEDAANYGLADGRQTWTADFGDMDNDGDLDLFKTQHDVICELFENINNDTFINITAQSGLVIGGVPLQGMFRDFDNDGFQDILVSGDRVDLWHNNGDKTFTKVNPFGTVIFGTFSLGDLNQDGFTDVYASRVIPFNSPDLFREDILYLNEPNNNHFLFLDLINTGGNPSAIGANAQLYGSWGVQVRDVRAGEQYGVSNSHKLIFGLGSEISYDSLVINWPDGTREWYNDLAVDKHWTLRKGDVCPTTSIQKWPDLEVLCDLDSVILKADQDMNNVQWSNGSTEDSIVIKEDGLYFASYLDANNCLVRTTPVEVISDPDTVKPVITFEANIRLCHGDLVQLVLPYGLAYLWSTGETEQTILAVETGEYFATVQGYCKSQQSDTVSLNFLKPEIPVTVQDTFSDGESAILTALGDSIIWYDDELNIIATGPILVLDGLTESTTVFAQNLQQLAGQDFQIGPVTQQGNTKYNASFVNGGLLFEVYEAIVLKEFTVYTDSVGTRRIEISNGSDFFYEKQVDLDTGANVISFDIELPIGSYTISTNTALNNLVFGENSPYLWRSSDGFVFPFEINSVMSITNSTYGIEFYYYFYDWKISTSDHYCGSDLVPVTAVYYLDVAADDPVESKGLIISPNPTNGLAKMIIQPGSPFILEISNMEGIRLNISNLLLNEGDHYELDLTNQPSGMYFIRIIREGRSFCKKIIKL